MCEHRKKKGSRGASDRDKETLGSPSGIRVCIQDELSSLVVSVPGARWEEKEEVKWCTTSNHAVSINSCIM